MLLYLIDVISVSVNMYPIKTTGAQARQGQMNECARNIHQLTTAQKDKKRQLADSANKN